LVIESKSVKKSFSGKKEEAGELIPRFFFFYSVDRINCPSLKRFSDIFQNPSFWRDSCTHRRHRLNISRKVFGKNKGKSINGIDIAT